MILTKIFGAELDQIRCRMWFNIQPALHYNNCAAFRKDITQQLEQGNFKWPNKSGISCKAIKERLCLDLAGMMWGRSKKQPFLLSRSYLVLPPKPIIPHLVNSVPSPTRQPALATTPLNVETRPSPATGAPTHDGLFGTLEQRIKLLHASPPRVVDGKEFNLSVGRMLLRVDIETNRIVINDLVQFLFGVDRKTEATSDAHNAILNDYKWAGHYKKEDTMNISDARVWARTVTMEAVVDIIDDLLNTFSDERQILEGGLSCSCNRRIHLVGSAEAVKSDWNHARYTHNLGEDRMALVCWDHGDIFNTKKQYNNHQEQHHHGNGLL